MINQEKYFEIKNEIKNVHLVAVSKFKSPEDILALYNLGHRDFGENYVQELIDKQEELPKDIQWHFIGHLQSNKVKYIAPFVHLIQSVDSEKLLKEINKQAIKNNRNISVLLQVHIADEETKFGLDANEIKSIISTKHIYSNIEIKGLMGMATFTEDKNQVAKEFESLKNIYDQYPEFSILSMGMSDDYQLAISQGSNMIRIGSLIFGRR